MYVYIGVYVYNTNVSNTFLLCTYYVQWTRKWQPTPVFLPGESHGQGNPSGLQSMGS